MKHFSIIEKDKLNQISNLSTESVIEVKGKVKEEKQAPSGIEILAETINILSDLLQTIAVLENITPDRIKLL